MVDFNKKFIDTEELQSEINKMKNEIINSNNKRDLADIILMKKTLEILIGSMDSLRLNF